MSQKKREREIVAMSSTAFIKGKKGGENNETKFKYSFTIIINPFAHKIEFEKINFKEFFCNEIYNSIMTKQINYNEKMLIITFINTTTCA